MHGWTRLPRTSEEVGILLPVQSCLLPSHDLEKRPGVASEAGGPNSHPPELPLPPCKVQGWGAGEDVPVYSVLYRAAFCLFNAMPGG